MNRASDRDELTRGLFWPVVSVLGLGALIFLAALGLYASQTGLTSAAAHFLALDSTHIWWYFTRAAGIMGYMLLWLSVVLGFAVSTKILNPFLDRPFTYDFHEHLSLLSLGFIAFHALVLMFDPYEPLSLLQILVPFTSSYRPFWVGLGVIGLYLTVLVTVTFYLRNWISMRVFRSIHYLSVVAYLGSLLHGWFAGSDTSLPFMQSLYVGTSLASIFLLTYRLVGLWQGRRRAVQR